MKQLLLPFILLISVFGAVAQNNNGIIIGKIITADGVPAPSSMVYVKGYKTIVYTSTDGTFRITAPEGNQMLMVQTTTRKQKGMPVVVTAGQTLNLPEIRLEESANDLKEVVITGQYGPQSVKNSLYDVRTITSEKIRLRGATDLKTVLSTELGFRFSNDPATGISDPQLLGMSGASIKILLDGVPVMDRGTSKESLGQIDINNVERIEVVEGPMSVIYGTDAMAGVINIITKKGHQNSLSVTAKVTEESAGKEYQLFDKKGTHNENLGVNWQHNGWQLGASGSRNNFGGWQGSSTGRAKEWLPKDQWLTTATAGYKNQKVDIWYRFNGTDETLYAFGNVNTNITPPVAADQKFISKRWFHQLQGSLFINDKLTVDAAASYTDYSRRTLSTNVDINTGKETLSLNPGAQAKDEFGSAFFRSTVQYKLSQSVLFQPGVEFNRNTGTGDRITGKPVISDYAFFFSTQLQLNKAIQVQPGFRLSKNSTYNAPPIVPSLLTKIRLNDVLDLRMSYARGFRAPILRELYFVFKDASHDIVGNPNLKAEYSNNFNASLAWAVKSDADFRINTKLNGSFNDYRNRIALGVDANNGNVNTYLNISKYKTIVGALNTALYWKNLRADLGFIYVGQYNELSEEKDQFGNSPEFTWSPEINTNISYLLPKIGTNISLFYKWTGKTVSYRTATGTDGKVVATLGELYGYHMADLTLNKAVNKYLSITAGARNLFDVTRIRNTGGGTSVHDGGATAPLGFGRSYFVGLTMQWNKK